MVTALALFAAALGLQAGADEPPPPLLCSLVTPGGDAVDFSVPGWNEGGNEIVLAGFGTAWPARTIPGARGVMRSGSARAARMFAFGSNDGIALDLGELPRNRRFRAATLHRRDGTKVGLPVAFGYCALPPEPVSMVYRALDPNADPGDIGANIPAFDPARWPESDCGMVISDERRARFGFQLDTSGSVQLSSPILWSGRPVTVPIRWERPRDGLQFGTFGRRGGPIGTQIMHVDESRHDAVKLIELSNLGDRSSANQVGYAICGYRGLVRRPAGEG